MSFWLKVCGRSLVIVMALCSSIYAAPTWTQIHENKGIRVYERDSDLGDLPDFKAISRVKASLFDLIAVLQDIDRRDEWVHRCTVSKTVKRFSEFEILLYHKTDSPWPVYDRDVAIQTKLYEMELERKYLAHFKGVKVSSIPENKGMIRLPQIEGYYLLNYIAPQETEVIYFVHLNPGGALPHWLVKIATRDLPTKTIIGLRKQIKKTKSSNVYRSFHERWNSKLRPVGTPAPTRPPYPSPKLIKHLGI